MLQYRLEAYGTLSAEKDVSFVLFRRTWSIQRNIGGSGIGLRQAVGDKVLLHFLSADIGEHDSINFNAGREWLATLLLHFPSEGRVLDDVLFFVRQIVFLQDCPDPVAPAARGFEIGDNLRFIHNA